MEIAEKDVNSYYRAVLDALPFVIFIVDDDVRIQDFNRTAVKVFYLQRPLILNEKGGDVLQCIHANDSPEGCGNGPLCNTCIVRNTVEKSLEGKIVTHEHGRFTVIIGEKEKELELTVTANPIDIEGKKLAVLVIEGIEEK